MTDGKTTKSRAEKGYGLVELVLVLACAAVVAASAAPDLFRLQKEWELWGGARLLESSLQWGRMHAIAANTSVLLQIDGGQKSFYWADPLTKEPYAASVRHLPGGVKIVKYPAKPLRFYPHGNAAPAGTYVLEGKAGSYSVIVAPGGRIRIVRN